jgi:hypothetical protein
MKQLLAVAFLAVLTAIVACKKDDPVNLNGPGFQTPFNCQPGTVVNGYPCQNFGPLGGGQVIGYSNPVNIVSRSVLENLMAEVFFVCYKNNAFGMANCEWYSSGSLDVVIESVAPITGGGMVTGTMNSVYVTIYPGATRQPLVTGMGYWPTGNSTGFVLRSSASQYEVRVQQGQLGVSDPLNVELWYRGGLFANGFLNRYR